MSLKSQNSNSPVKTNNNEAFIKVKAEIAIEFYAVSKEALEQMEDVSNKSKTFEICLFFFSLSVGFFTTLLLPGEKSKLSFSMLLIAASVTLSFAIFKYLSYKKERRKVSTILKKARKNKCTLL